MKILKIKSLNINSLKGENEIDFESFLHNDSIFAITGSTGAGKSTILDVIACAMYGKTARLKNPNELMSRHTGESLCEVEFEIKGKIYLSSWSIKRSRGNSDGKLQNAKMELSDAQSEKIIASGLRDVPRFIEDLSGLDFDRFNQSMMLTQGKFDAFLKAKESDRAALLEKITGTQIYAEISKEIYQKYIDITNETQTQKSVIDSIELFDDAVLKDKQKALNENKENKDKFQKKKALADNSIKWIETLQILQNELNDLLENIEKTDNEIVKNSEIYDERKRVKEQETKISQKEIIKIKQARVIETKLSEQSKQLANINVKIKECEQIEIKTKTDLNKIKQIFIDVESKIEHSRTYLTKHSKDEKLIELIALMKQNLDEYKTQTATLEVKICKDREYKADLQSKKIKLDDAKKDLQSSQKSYYESKKSYIDIENISKDDQKDEDNLRIELDKVKTYLLELKNYERAVKNKDVEKKSMDALSKQKQPLEQTIVDKAKFIDEIKKHIGTLESKKDQELLIKKYEDDRDKLVDGESCFLCGSKNHPFGSGILIKPDETLNRIKDKKELLNEEENEYNSINKSLATIDAKLESTKLEIEKLDAEIEQISVEVRTHTKDKLVEEKEVIDQKIKEIVTIREQKNLHLRKREVAQKDFESKKDLFDKLSLDIRDIEAKDREIVSKIEDIKGSINTLQKWLFPKWSEYDLEFDELKYQEQFEILRSLSDSFIKHKSNLEDLKTELNKIELDKTRLIEVKSLLQKDLKSENENRLVSNNSINELTTKLKSILNVENIDKYEQDLKNSLEEAYKDENSALGNLNSLKVQNSEMLKSKNSLTKKIDDAEKNGFASTNELEKYKKQVMIDSPLLTLQDEVKELENIIDDLQKSIGSYETELNINNENQKRHQKLKDEHSQSFQEYEVWTKLKDMIGSNDGRKFAKFAQGITLDQLIILANRHLVLLTNRYELIRNQEQPLDLEIKDGYQGGVIRSVSTLSGGESFIMSLALALGLSELASQKISIDSLFLDEGFGTLDEESLDMAITALSHLQNRGKMVGVISHVEALKERIPAQIKVIPNGDGTSFIRVDS